MKARLFLIDGHALIFKMYYAFLRRPMINSKGEDTSILFGFTKYLLEMIHREEPTHLAVAFDLREAHSGMRCILNTRPTGTRLPSLS